MSKIDLVGLTIKVLGDYTDLSFAFRHKLATQIKDEINQLKAQGRWNGGD
jgi:hypothetical protein